MGLDVPLSYDVLEEDDSIAAPRSAFDIFAAPLPEDFRTTSPRERNVVPEQPVANPRAFARSKKARSFFTSEPAAEAISDGSEEEKQEEEENGEDEKEREAEQERVSKLPRDELKIYPYDVLTVRAESENDH